MLMCCVSVAADSADSSVIVAVGSGEHGFAASIGEHGRLGITRVTLPKAVVVAVSIGQHRRLELCVMGACGVTVSSSAALLSSESTNTTLSNECV